jgi:hypothetical protein
MKKEKLKYIKLKIALMSLVVERAWVSKIHYYGSGLDKMGTHLVKRITYVSL